MKAFEIAKVFGDTGEASRGQQIRKELAQTQGTLLEKANCG